MSSPIDDRVGQFNQSQDDFLVVDKNQNGAVKIVMLEEDGGTSVAYVDLKSGGMVG